MLLSELVIPSVISAPNYDSWLVIFPVICPSLSPAFINDLEKSRTIITARDFLYQSTRAEMIQDYFPFDPIISNSITRIHVAASGAFPYVVFFGFPLPPNNTHFERPP
jgi:hypothetical protein